VADYSAMNRSANSDDDQESGRQAQADGVTDAAISRRKSSKGHGIQLMTAALAFLAGILGSGITSYVSYHAATTTQASQVAATSNEAIRQKRGDIYLAYLDAANEYALQTGQVSSDAFAAAKDSSKLTVLNSDLNVWRTDRANYQSEINLVYVYGSDQALSASDQVASALPGALGNDTDADIGSAVRGVNWVLFNSAYDKFLVVFCQDAPASPRLDCGHP
jgi:hypothetical protein